MAEIGADSTCGAEGCETPSTLQEEIACYNANLDSFVGEHGNEYVLIKGSSVVGYFPTEREAINAGYDRFGNQAFLVRPCTASRGPVLFLGL